LATGRRACGARGVSVPERSTILGVSGRTGVRGERPTPARGAVRAPTLPDQPVPHRRWFLAP
jgi:hypothetical protein